MRRLSFVIALVVLAGCADDNKKPDDGATKASSSQPKAQPQPQPQPQPKPAPKPAPAPATAETSSGGEEPIVIKGSKHKDSGSSATESEASRQAKIDELKAKAAASQGKDNGPAYRETQADPATSNDPNAKKDQIRQKIADIDAQTAKLKDEKAAMSHSETHRGPNKAKVTDTTFDDPDRAKAIDSQLEELKKQREILERRLAALEVGEDPAKGGAPK